MQDIPEVVICALDAWGLSGTTVTDFGSGLINRTLLVESGGDRFVLQQVNDIFPPAINSDIDVLTRHLVEKGLNTTTVIPTRGGSLWTKSDGKIWRLLTFVDGVSHDKLTSSGQAREAGRLLAGFHRAVGDLEIDFSNPRLGVHDTRRHLANLEKSLRDHRDHPRYAAVASLGKKILHEARLLPALVATPDRIVHGDPKINNLLFAREGNEALCLIDLDTIGEMPLPLELGDAMRSWCNPASEDNAEGVFAAEFFRSALQGYAGEAVGWIEPEEWRSIVPATLTVLVELAARFCADALNESYFGWDAEHYSSRSEHNQVRAAGQLTVARSLLNQKDELEATVSSIFSD